MRLTTVLISVGVSDFDTSEMKSNLLQVYSILVVSYFKYDPYIQLTYERFIIRPYCSAILSTLFCI